MNKNQGKSESICIVNIESNEISKIITYVPFQVKIYDDLTNNANIVNKTKAEVKKLLGINIMSNNYVITNLNKNSNNCSLNINFN